MAQPRTKTMSVPEQVDDGEIVITTRAVVGRVPYSRYGSGSPVEAAFGIVGKYLDEEGGNGNEASVEFRFLGMIFNASTTPENPENVQDEKMALAHP